MKKLETLSLWDVAYSVNMAIACLISYWIITYVLSGTVGPPGRAPLVMADSRLTARAPIGRVPSSGRWRTIGGPMRGETH